MELIRKIIGNLEDLAPGQDGKVNMDKKIRKIEKESKKQLKDLKSLEKEDKKRDPACEMGKKMMKKKKK